MRDNMKLYLSDIRFFSEDFFERADAVPPGKRKDLASYTHPVSRKEHILAWSLLSFAYQAETEKPVSEIRLTFSEKGKPYIESDPFFFSLSHSEGRVICAVAESEIGADVQRIKPVKDGVLKRVLCENERRLYEESDNKPLCFTRLWSLKESYLKYTGEGISAGLGSLDFSPFFEKDSFTLFGKRFSSFDDGEYACSVCSADKNMRIIRLGKDDLLSILK